MLASLLVVASVVSVPLHYEATGTVTQVVLNENYPGEPRWCSDRSDMPQVGSLLSIVAFSQSTSDYIGGGTLSLGPLQERLNATVYPNGGLDASGPSLIVEGGSLTNQIGQVVWTNLHPDPDKPDSNSYNRDCLFTFENTGTIVNIVGDSNHDGAFDSGDLVTVFIAGEYEDTIAENSTFDSGDWNADYEFDSGDLVVGFQGGHYEAGVAAVAVPEPTSLLLVVSCVWGLTLRRS